MSGSKLNIYAVGDVNLTNMMASENALAIGLHRASLTNWDNTDAPQIASGSLIECDGALYQFAADENITGSTANGTLYIKTIPSSNTVTAEFSTVAPSWNTSKQGWYSPSTGEENYRYMEFQVVRASSVYVKTRYPSYELGTIDPVGMISAFGGTSSPSGWLLCDGTGYSRATYSRLFSVLSTTWGSSDAASFKVPDLRGKFIRGFGGASTDLGLTQAEGYISHNHTASAIVTIPNLVITNGGNFASNYIGAGDGSSVGSYAMTGTSSVTVNANGGSETRPINMAFNYIIKY